MGRRKRQTAGELLAELNRNPAFRERAQQREEKQQIAREAIRRAEAPVVEDLRRHGFDVDSVWELVNTDAPYPRAIPILLRHLVEDYAPDVLKGIARALAVPEARFAWPILRELFEGNNEETTNGVKWALGCALSGAADDDVLDEIIEMVRDKRHGQNRIALFPALGQSGRARARSVLLELRHDPELKEAAEQTLTGRFDT